VKILLCGIIDREDGGYMCPIGFQIPDHFTTYREAFDHLMQTPTFVPKLLERFGDVYNDEREEEVFLTPKDVTWSFCGGIVMEYTLKDEDDCEFGESKTIGVDMLEVIE
jgi:hypothetical protein